MPDDGPLMAKVVLEVHTTGRVHLAVDMWCDAADVVITRNKVKEALIGAAAGLDWSDVQRKLAHGGDA